MSRSTRARLSWICRCTPPPALWNPALAMAIWQALANTQLLHGKAGSKHLQLHVKPIVYDIIVSPRKWDYPMVIIMVQT
jgi:hypothetical protein